ncbi:MAG: rhodanese-like domain-containing protein [Candidatus Methylacidiphilales bacterium]|nr:rhodanese-like domain-containing protein [Candidatus Methylacidiphilales bacterium]
MTLSVQELAQKQARGEKLRLVDVREPDEWQICRIPGAELIPLQEFAQQAPEKLEEDEAIVLYCHHGMRSARAQRFLQERGYKNVLNLTGGIDAWSQQVDPKVARY